MKTSSAGIELIKRWEGCRLTAYRDAVGVLTIGYGHTSMAGEPSVFTGMKITQQEAEDILIRDLAKYEAAVDRALTRTPTQPQFDACTAICFNIGQGAFASSTLVRRFNSGDVKGAADAFLMWNKAGGKVLQGLVNRRTDERKLFLTPVGAPEKPVPVTPAPVQPVAPETPPPPSPAPAAGLAMWVMGAAGALIVALATWLMKG